jgi:hypothetical protein
VKLKCKTHQIKIWFSGKNGKNGESPKDKGKTLVKWDFGGYNPRKIIP